jgi:hypothetical protein
MAKCSLGRHHGCRWKSLSRQVVPNTLGVKCPARALILEQLNSMVNLDSKWENKIRIREVKSKNFMVSTSQIVDILKSVDTIKSQMK